MHDALATSRRLEIESTTLFLQYNYRLRTPCNTPPLSLQFVRMRGFIDTRTMRGARIVYHESRVTRPHRRSRVD